MYQANVILDSLSPTGERLTTIEATFPRIILAEWNTHRALSRNAASSRAIPVEKMMQRVIDDPFIPEEWGCNQKGMQAGQPLTGADADYCKWEWLTARDYALKQAEYLTRVGVHKQLVNRLLEPFLWVTVVASATDWNNLFWQRCDAAAQPQFQKIAGMILREYNESIPTRMQVGQWHTPYIQPCEYHEFNTMTRLMVSVARCARVSYLSQNGKREVDLDLELYNRLRTGMHMSPFEHVAQASEFSGPDWKNQTGNFWGWTQYRKIIPNENRNRMTPEERAVLLQQLEAAGVSTD